MPHGIALSLGDCLRYGLKIARGCASRHRFGFSARVRCGRENTSRGLVVSAAAALALSGAAAQAETVTIKLETYAGPRHAMNTHGWPEWIKAAEAAAPGMFKFEMSYPPIDPRVLYDRVRSG